MLPAGQPDGVQAEHGHGRTRTDRHAGMPAELDRATRNKVKQVSEIVGKDTAQATILAALR